MNTQNDSSKKTHGEKNSGEKTESQIKADVAKAKERNTNFPENFGSLRHQKGDVEQDQKRKNADQEEENENSERYKQVEKPEYRDPSIPSGGMERTRY